MEGSNHYASIVAVIDIDIDVYLTRELGSDDLITQLLDIR